VHINFVDSSTEEVRGDPDVRDGVLYVTSYGSGRASVLFEAAFPLRHVKSWWVDYEADDGDAARMPAGLDA
jgi:hypothetical protein